MYQTRGMTVSDVARERLDSQTQQHNCAQNTAPRSQSGRRSAFHGTPRSDGRHGSPRRTTRRQYRSQTLPAAVVPTLAVVPTAVSVAALASWLVTRRQRSRTRATRRATPRRATHSPTHPGGMGVDGGVNQGVPWGIPSRPPKTA
ncbi:hypothetical protein PBI_OKIROE_95 [Mycobacterium phage OkiRoe]|uniref:hypothetical protein n=1 Tax=Mycobacterium phage OkiRoe TaxID=1486473 RepID=UPI00045F6FA0|nr:hypothetical protein PBI_OKIROE_95 [Mycobacterium phage OkiRoe]AHZ95656.1 hypothetical protein PBI_OKIROE_95 [Mycobacterium phage OkiRoe]